MKRKWVIVLIVILAMAAVFLHFRRNGGNPFIKDTSLYQAIPGNVPVFAELSSLREVSLRYSVIEKWLDVKTVRSFTTWVLQLDSVIRENNDIQSSVRNDRFIVAFSFPGGKHPIPLVIMKAESGSRKSSLEVLARALFPEPEFTYSEFDYTGCRIIAAVDADNRHSFYYSFSNGLYVASPSVVMVQQSLLQLNEPGILEDSSFRKLTKAMDSEPGVAWYTNQQLFPDILAEYVNQSSITVKNEFGEDVKTNHYRSLQNFKKFGAWSELEAVFDDAAITLQGFTVADDSLNHFLSVFDGQNPQRSNAAKVLPRNTTFFTSYTFSDKKKFFGRLEKYFSMAGAFYKREDLIRKMNKGLKTNLRESFQSIVKNEVIVAITDIPAETDRKSTFFLMEIAGKRKAENLLDSMLNNYALQSGKLPEDYKLQITIDEKKQFTLIEFPFPSFPGIWLGKPFYSAQARFAVFYSGYLVFANSETALQNYLFSMESKEFLAGERWFKKIRSNADNSANISVYLNSGPGKHLIPEIFSADMAKKINRKKDFFNQWQAVGWQVSGGNKAYKNTISLIFDDGRADEEEPGFIVPGTTVSADRGNVPVMWQAKLGSAVTSKPVITVNHNDKDTREIMVSDQSNKLYQVSNNGTVRWSFDAGDPILSEIWQIDYLANGKLQYLFSTKNKLFLLDRNGVVPEGFPVSFPAEATAGVSVADYDNNRVYRYFVPCADKRIYVWNKEGKLLEGWKFEGTKTPVTTPVQFFRVKGKDYIVFKDKSHVYIQNRKGEPVAKTAAGFVNSRNQLMITPAGEPRIVATDNKGRIYFIGFDGNYIEKSLRKFSDEHFFRIEDINGDNKPELIFADNDELTVMSEDGTVIFTQKVAGKIVSSPQVFRFGNRQKKIGITDSKGRIYLFDEKGQLQTGFPLPGSTNFSIGKISQNAPKLSLIVGNKNGNVICYGL